MKKILFIAGLLLILSACGTSDDKTTVVDLVTVPATSDRWTYLIDGDNQLVAFTTDSVGKARLDLEIDSVKHLILIHSDSNFSAETWVMPGEQCEITVNRVAPEPERQISTTGVFKERTEAAYSKAFGEFYQLVANDNFYVELNGDEVSYVDFLIAKYKEHLDTLNCHPELPSAVRKEALRTLNNKMIDHIEDPTFWLEFCANLRGYTGPIAPTSLSKKSKERAYKVIVE